jgi:hypothetical protein
LAQQPVGEVRLKRRRQRGPHATLPAGLSRLATSASSSGAADR